MAALSSSLCLHASLVSKSNQSTPHNLLSTNYTEVSTSRSSDGHWGVLRSLSVDCRSGRGTHLSELVQRHSSCQFAEICSWDSKSVYIGVPYDHERASLSRVWSTVGIRSDGRHHSEPAGRPSELIPKVLRGADSLPETIKSEEVIVDSSEAHVNVDNGGDGGNAGGENGNFGGGGGGDDDADADRNGSEDDEFGPLLNADEVNKQVRARGVKLPADMIEAARTVGIRSLLLSRFMDLQGAGWPLGAAIRGSSPLRNRMLADQGFLFKVLTEIAIDSGCATFAEVQKRGDDFWNEFELYMADLLVGVVVDVALVGMLAPFVRFGGTVPASGMMAPLSNAIQALPSSVFEAALPGRRFSIQQRVASYFYKGIQYGAVGFGCGIIGQGIANAIMILKRKLKKSDEKDVPVPPLLKSAALWGVFLAISSNTRYQIINGLERVVEGSPIGRRLPPVAMAFTVGIRFANNVYGGMQFVDWARWSGVQ